MSLVLITGCSSGIGLEAALGFSRRGYTVVACVRRPGSEEVLLQRAGDEGLAVHIRYLDVSLAAGFGTFLEALERDFGPIDILVNNAGILRHGAFEELPESAIRNVMETNFFGPLLLSRAVLPSMRARGAGLIIMVSSLSGIAGLAGDVIYSASKFALEGATEALRYECGRFGIRFALIESGAYATGIHRSRNEYHGKTVDRSSPYAALIGAKLDEAKRAGEEAAHPRKMADLMLDITEDDSGRFRWQADDLAQAVLGRLWRADDSERDAFLREAADIDWWLEGKDKAGDNDPG